MDSLLVGNQSHREISQPQLDLSVVVPIYNEVESVPKLIDAIASSLIASQLSYEIICVDDGSRDGSAELLKQLALNRQVR